jgi:predicted nucleic acid-binding protein
MYFDTSALVKRYVSEVGSHWVRITLAQSSPNVVYASALAQPEVLSALQRKVREAQLTQVDAHRLARRVTNHFAWRYRLLAITPGVIAQACALVQAHPLRAYDAVHLACALAVHERLRQYGGPLLYFVAADATLLAAATAEGLEADNPLWHP